MAGDSVRGEALRCLVLALSLLLAVPQPATAQAPGGVGVMGDSASDEYRADDNRGGAYVATTFNWLELLVRHRGVNAGPWGSWGGSRRTGYAYNWARSGARASDLIAEGQAAGLAQQVAEGRIAWALLMIGTNDFALTTYTDIYNGTLSGAALSVMTYGIVASIVQAVDTVRAAGPVILLVTTIPTALADSPAAQRVFPDAAGRHRVVEVMGTVNAGLRSALPGRGVTLVDLDGLVAALGPRRDGKGNVKVGDQLISFVVPGDEPHHSLLGDSRHAGTVMGDLLANYFLDHLAAAGGPDIPRFTDAELLANAGILPVSSSAPAPRVATSGR
jgi:GDSL-like lipase/acylhydrolase family protein